MDPSIARAVFTTALLPADANAPEVRREDAALFTKSLLRTLNLCTAREIQACKSFIIRNILPSTQRTAALAKYLLFLGKNCAPRNPGSVLENAKQRDDDEGLGRTPDGKLMQPPDAAFKRLHLLYVVHDVICFLATRMKDPQHAQHMRCNDLALENLKTHACLLAQLAACSESKPRAGRATLESVRRVLKLWRKLEILDASALDQLGAKCEDASTMSWDELQQKSAADEAHAALSEQRRREEDMKWMLPAQHHLPNDPSAPWHELPAANALFQKRTRGYPLRAGDLPPGGYRLRNGAHQADEGLKAEVEQLHKEALRCFDKYTNAEDVRDIDAMGNIIWKDRPTRNFWGFEVNS